LAFDDAPREDTGHASTCLRLKRRLTVRFPPDRIAHSEARPDLIVGVPRRRGLE
jgi:hypothetical protein